MKRETSFPVAKRKKGRKSRLCSGAKLECNALLLRIASSDRRSSLDPPLIILVLSANNNAELGDSVGAAVAVFAGATDEHLAALLSGDALHAAFPAWTGRQIGGVWTHAVKEADVIPYAILHARLDAQADFELNGL